jgi:pseudouridine-5'-monophosphatase
MVFKTVEYVIFDVDGLMIDSESVYTKVTNDILGKYGKSMTWEMKSGCMGRPEREAATYLLSYFPDIPLTIDSYLTQRNIGQDLLWPTVKLLPGVEKLIFHLFKHNIPVAVATSSKRRNFNMKTGHLADVFRCFQGKVVCGDDDGGTIMGKPEPDIFLVAAREKLEKKVGSGTECSEEEKAEREKGLVFEDAIPGMQAGKRAGMSVVWVPDVSLLDVEYSGSEKADLVLKSVEDFAPEQWGLPPYDP